MQAREGFRYGARRPRELSLRGEASLQSGGQAVLAEIVEGTPDSLAKGLDYEHS